MRVECREIVREQHISNFITHLRFLFPIHLIRTLWTTDDKSSFVSLRHLHCQHPIPNLISISIRIQHLKFQGKMSTYFLLYKMLFYNLISQIWAPNKRLKVFLATSQRYRHHISKLLRCGRRSTLTTEKEALCYGLQIIIMTKNWQPLYLMNVSCVFVFFFLFLW